MHTVDFMKEKVKNHLKPSRYKHTLGVMAFAIKLSKVHHISVEKAQIAALLHDYCKYETDENILNALRKEHLPIDHVIKNSPNLGHGQMAAIVARTVFDIDDEDILNAISHHTFGCVDMSDLEKIIYLSDSLEENRVYEGVEAFRSLAIKNLDQAIIAVSGHTMMYEISKGHMIHENTVLMRNALLELV